MGSKEFSVGIFSFKEGTNFIKFPTMEDVREVFLLYHMNIIPMAITHTPIVIIVGNFNILAFSVSISLLISLAKSDLYHMRKLLMLV